MKQDHPKDEHGGEYDQELRVLDPMKLWQRKAKQYASLKLSLEEHRKAVMKRDTMKSTMTDQVWRERVGHQSL